MRRSRRSDSTNAPEGTQSRCDNARHAIQDQDSTAFEIESRADRRLPGLERLNRPTLLVKTASTTAHDDAEEERPLMALKPVQPQTGKLLYVSVVAICSQQTCNVGIDTTDAHDTEVVHARHPTW